MIAVDALTTSVIAAAVIAPIAASVIPLRPRNLLIAGAAATLWTIASASLLIGAGFDLATVTETHVVLFLAILALAALGFLFRSLLHDALDAVAASVCVSVVLTFGLFAIGRFAGALPLPVLNAALATNPLVATSAAAGIDLFRTELLYRISPLPHLLFTYPSWRVSSVVFGAIAIVSSVCSWWRGRTALPRVAG